MCRCKPFILVIIGICTLNGCGLIHELKDDPAIVGVTGFNLIAGIDPAINSPFPAPKVHMNWGTMFRVGPHDCVYISTAGGASAYTKPPAKLDTTTPTPSTKALEKATTDAKNKATSAKDAANTADQNPGDTSKKQAAQDAKQASDEANATVKALQNAVAAEAVETATKASGRTPATAPSQVTNTCIPTVAPSLSTTSDSEVGAGGQAHLTISVNGLTAMQKRWEMQARLDELLNGLPDILEELEELPESQRTAENLINIINALHSLADDKQHIEQLNQQSVSAAQNTKQQGTTVESKPATQKGGDN